MVFDFGTFELKLVEAKKWLAKEYQSLRTGRAAPALLDGVMVDAYGSRTPLKQVVNIGIEGARSLAIAPYDASLTKEIERGIISANLGVGTAVSGSLIRVTFPDLTHERRLEMVKIAKQKLEEARIAVRSSRDDVWSDIQAEERDNTIREDEKFRLKEDLQKKVDSANDELEDLFNKKEREITE